MSKNRLKVGLNGSPGSKLTDVSNKFRKFGINVFDADLQIKWLINYDKQVFSLTRLSLLKRELNHPTIHTTLRLLSGKVKIS
jgi:dephospho-CoA kinase